MTTDRWPDVPMIGAAELPPVLDESLWPSLFTLAERLPSDHVVIGGVMVYLHGAAAGRQPVRVTRDVDVLMNIEVLPSALKDAVAVRSRLGYRVAPDSPPESTHRTAARRPSQCPISRVPWSSNAPHTRRINAADPPKQ
ncbi:hypothetical protein [Alloactinosynnema sp. L-07]|uniref:hypothetical protein n=1 Tax=Alloactinosynnema sp. L-07 TaxID=1653480 RepID=UPI00065EF910|nr:hypothetical protein [Alloactinosynnema sp. L-07]CRK60862.1 hypothetical protein [Alloactinosynnema sp. L-07]